MRSIWYSSRYLALSDFRCSTISVPRATRLASSSLAGATSKPEPPDDDQVQASLEPARRLGTTMRSATMKGEEKPTPNWPIRPVPPFASARLHTKTHDQERPSE